MIINYFACGPQYFILLVLERRASKYAVRLKIPRPAGVLCRHRDDTRLKSGGDERAYLFD